MTDLPLIPRKQLFGNFDYSKPKISPSGDLLAYLAPNEQGVINVWVRSVAKKDAKMITNDQNRGIQDYFWQGDNQHILYLQDKGGDKNWHLFQTHIVNSRTRNLTPFDKVQTKILFYNPFLSNNKIIIGLNKDNLRVHDAYLLDIEEGEITLKAKNAGTITQFCSDHNFEVRAALKVNTDGSHTVLTRENEKSDWEDLTSLSIEDQKCYIIGFHPNNTALWLVSSSGCNTKRLLQIDLKTKKKTILFEDENYDVAKIILHPSTQKIQAVGTHTDYFKWTFLDPEMKTEFDNFEKTDKGMIKIVSRDNKNRYWTISYLEDTHPPKYYLYDSQIKKLTFLFDSKKNLKKYKLAKTTPFSFYARDNMLIHGYYTLPPVSRKNFPTIILVHGGPYLRDTWGFNPVVQWLSNRGYAVFQINYRGSTGYGKKYMNAAKKEWGGRMHSDLIDAKKWAIKNKIADSKRVAIMGTSYGGYAALVGLTFTPKEFCCAVSYMGPSSLISLIKSFPPYMSSLRYITKVFIGDPIKDKQFLMSRSPLFKVDQIRAPILIAQGANDHIVSQKESDQIVQAIRKRNNLKVEYLLFPDEGHEFVKPQNRLKCFAATEEFLLQYLGGRFEPVQKDEDWQDVRN